MRILPALLFIATFLLLGSIEASADTGPREGELFAEQQDEARTDIDRAPTRDPGRGQPGESEHGESFDEEDEEPLRIVDPFYPWNKAMYHVNDKFYFWLLKPVSQGYAAVFPEDVRLSVRHFFDNLAMPIRLASSLLQLKIKDAGNELFRFLYNSTAGVCGLTDAAKADLGIARKDEDIGQALGRYGVGHGIYLVWPFLGPSSLRDTVGRIGDRLLSPVNYIDPAGTSVGVTLYERVNETSLRIGDYEDLKKSAVDPYLAIRDAYLQFRKKKVSE